MVSAVSISGRIPGRRLIAASELAVVVLAAVVLVAACGGAPPATVRSVASPSVRAASAAATPSAAGTPSRTASAAPARVVSPGLAGTYGVAERQMTLAEPAHVGVTGQHHRHEHDHGELTGRDQPPAGDAHRRYHRRILASRRPNGRGKA